MLSFFIREHTLLRVILKQNMRFYIHVFPMPETQHQQHTNAGIKMPSHHSLSPFQRTLISVVFRLFLHLWPPVLRLHLGPFCVITSIFMNANLQDGNSENNYANQRVVKSLFCSEHPAQTDQIRFPFAPRSPCAPRK